MGKEKQTTTTNFHNEEGRRTLQAFSDYSSQNLLLAVINTTASREEIAIS